ncbi:MAG: ATP synthase F1 subunit delta [Planctomycetota bacterium]|jgi:F-type H+-transporting ATPase subunit delta|nr:ATP synthase F1 subunit delta [Planctomycetota bacterium]
MAQEDIIARRYARGLAEEAAANGSMDEVRRDVRALAGIVDPGSGPAHAPEFVRVLGSPAVEPSAKIAFAESVAEKAGFRAESRAFLAVLIRHDRVGLMPRIARAFADIAGPLTGVFTADVHTARPLRDDQAERLRKVLSAALGAEVVLHERVEPLLLAGARVVVGDKTIDGTVLGRLERLRRRLSERGVFDFEELEQETAETAEA